MTTTDGYRRGGHVPSGLHVHLDLVTKYRRGVLTGEHTRYPNGVCSDFGAVLAESNGEGGHVHLLAGYPPTVPVAALVNSLKDVSARMLRHRYQIRTHRDHLCAFPSCGVLRGPAAADHPAVR
jgi:putative transposase